jgi:hypothetical protein
MHKTSLRPLVTRCAVVGFVLLASSEPLWAQAGADIRQRLFTEAPERWREVERFAPKVQGRVVVTITVKIPKRNIDDTDTISYTVLQNDRCAMLRGSPIQSRRNDPLEYVFFSNSWYSAYIRRDPGKSKEFLLNTYDPNPDALLVPAPSPIRKWAFVTLFPHFSFQGQRLSEIIISDGFRVEKVTMDDQGLVVATIRYDLSKTSSRRQLMEEATLTFDPQRWWCIRTCKEKVIIPGREGSTNHITVEFMLDDHPSGFPLVRRQMSMNMATSAESGSSHNQRVVEYELRVDESVSDSEFTLSAFGLPEPVGVVWEKKTPVYVWLLVAAAVLGMLALFFRWLAQRRQRRNLEG